MRVAGNDFSVDPRAIGRFVDVIATPVRVAATCDGQIVADHERSWGRELTITDPTHRETARALRADLAERRRAAERSRATRAHADGHVVALHALLTAGALLRSPDCISGLAWQAPPQVRNHVAATVASPEPCGRDPPKSGTGTACPETPLVGKDGVMSGNTSRRYPVELREIFTRNTLHNRAFFSGVEPLGGFRAFDPHPSAASGRT